MAILSVSKPFAKAMFPWNRKLALTEIPLAERGVRFLDTDSAGRISRAADTKVVVRFSAIMFDRTHTHAVLHYSYKCIGGSFCGILAGTALLCKGEGRWYAISMGCRNMLEG